MLVLPTVLIPHNVSNDTEIRYSVESVTDSNRWL